MPTWIEAILALAAVAVCTVACWREDRLIDWEEKIPKRKERYYDKRRSNSKA